tara:strand:+ start:134 stop:664 length:531 start_codon:yes stop_codon:yes gene_type:complete
MNKTLIILLILSFSFNQEQYNPNQFDFIKIDNIEYSMGINDKTGLYGLISKSWLTDKPYGESYITASGVIIAGAIGYGQKRYFSKGKFFSSYVSWTGFGYYALPMSENTNINASLAVSGVLGLEFTPIKWDNNQIKFQGGLFTSYDPIKGENLIVEGEGGPSFLMPSINVQIRFKK